MSVILDFQINKNIADKIADFFNFPTRDPFDLNDLQVILAIELN
jgi:hypothetical protein